MSRILQSTPEGGQRAGCTGAKPRKATTVYLAVGTLLNLLAETGGLMLATGTLAQFAGPGRLHPLLAFVTGLASLGSSSSVVVMPLFVPLVPGLLGQLGGGDGVTAMIAIDVDSHMVDVSPLSTLGPCVWRPCRRPATAPGSSAPCCCGAWAWRCWAPRWPGWPSTWPEVRPGRQRPALSVLLAEHRTPAPVRLQGKTNLVPQRVPDSTGP